MKSLTRGKNASKGFYANFERSRGKFFSGVPDSLLTPFTDEVIDRYGISDKHIVAANEGAAVGLAAGHYLTTGKPAVVYMQNSGIGNAMNPICSLIHQKVYAIPVIFVIGWRGEHGINDEPQHVFQGEVTLKMLELVEIPYVVVSKDSDLAQSMTCFKQHLENGTPVAFVIKKNALVNKNGKKYVSNMPLTREEVLKIILAAAKLEDVFVCTTGKLSREIYEIRKNTDGVYSRDFLTVGSMGHSLMIAFGIALAKPDRRVFCLDGDGSMLMHMGSVAVVGAHAPRNLVHIVINNGAHETVGGLPAVSGKLELHATAKACWYGSCIRADSEIELAKVLGAMNETEMSNHVETKQQTAKKTHTANTANSPTFIEILCNLHSRKDLGRPTTTPAENKKIFMERLK